MLRLFIAEARYFDRGTAEHRTMRNVIVANDKAEALGLALESDLKTLAGNWTVKEVASDKSGVHRVYTDCYSE